MSAPEPKSRPRLEQVRVTTRWDTGPAGFGRCLVSSHRRCKDAAHCGRGRKSSRKVCGLLAISRVVTTTPLKKTCTVVNNLDAPT